MSKHLQIDMNRIKKELLNIASMVEVSVDKAIHSFANRQPGPAQEVINDDRIIDEKEVCLEEDCLKILALHQPVANDLRFIITMLKVNNDLERMGDLAVNIAERSLYLCAKEQLQINHNLLKMAEDVRRMLSLSLDALTHIDTQIAKDVMLMDDLIDDVNRQTYKIVRKVMRQDPESIKRALHILSISRHLERIADLATNIAEDVVYMADGELIRHRTEDYLSNDD